MADAGLQQERADLALTERELKRVRNRLARLVWAADRVRRVTVTGRLSYVEHEIMLTQKILADLNAHREAVLRTIAILESESANARR